MPSTLATSSITRGDSFFQEVDLFHADTALGEGVLADATNCVMENGDVRSRNGMVQMALRSRSSILDNMVAYWPLNEESGERRDLFGGNNLTDNNTVTAEPGVFESSRAAHFIRANSEDLSLTDNTDFDITGTSFTYFGWFYVEDATANQYILSKFDSSSSREYFVEVNQFTNDMRFGIYDDNQTPVQIEAASGTVLATKRWHWFRAYYDFSADTINIRVNEGPVGTFSSTNYAINSTTSSFRIGSVLLGTFFFNGRISEVGFMTSVMTDAEAADVYNEGKGRHWPFSTTEEKIYGIGRFQDPNNFGTDFLVSAGEDKLHVMIPPTYHRTVAYPTGEKVLDDCTILQANDKLLVLRKGSRGLQWDGVFGNAIVTIPDDTGATTNIPSSDYGIFHMNRLYIKDGKDDVLYSDITINTDFNAVVDQFKVNRGSDDAIQRISGLSENTIVIHKDKSIFLVTGVSGSLSALVLTLLTNDFGIAGPLAYTSMGGDAAFMTKDKRIFTIGQTLEAKFQITKDPISRKMQPEFDRINHAAIRGVTMGFREGRLYVGYPHGGATTLNNRISVMRVVDGTWQGRWTLPAGVFCKQLIIGRLWGEDRVFFVTPENRLFVLEEGPTDLLTDRQVQIEADFTTRTYFTDTLEDIKITGVGADVLTWNPKLTLEVIRPGVSESFSLFTDQTRNRLQYQNIDFSTGVRKVAWVPTNTNDDFDDPYREDYSVVLDDATNPGLALKDGLKLEEEAHYPIKYRVHLPAETAQVKFTNKQGKFRVRKITVQAAAGRHTHSSFTT